LQGFEITPHKPDTPSSSLPRDTKNTLFIGISTASFAASLFFDFFLKLWNTFGKKWYNASTLQK
jgi:hypothetical protein